MNTKRIVVGSLTAVAFLALARWDWTRISALAAGAEPVSPILAEFDFDPGEPQLTVPVELGMNRYRLGLATRESSSFGKPFANTLPRLPAEVDVSDDSIFASRMAPRASLGGIAVRFPRSSVLCELSPIGNERFSQCDAVVGLDVLVQHIVQIDFDDRKIRFLRAIPEAPGDRFEIVSLHKRPRLCAVTVKAQCCSEPADEFSVELESPDAIYLRSSVCRRLFDNGELRWPHDESTFDVTRVPFCCVGTASSFTLGRFRTNDVRAVVHRDNVIGMGYLSRYVVTFDFPNGAMYLRPGKQFDREDGYDASGLFARMRDDGLVVGDCRFQSPAYEAGLQEQDVILDVDGQPVNLKNQSSFRKKILQQGSTVHVHFKRGGLDRNVEMKLPVIHRKVIDKNKPIPGTRAGDKIPDFEPRSAPSELLEIEQTDEPQNASRGHTLTRRGAGA